VSGLDTGALLLAPAVVLLAPLIAGRYPGERRLRHLVARRAARGAAGRRAVSVPLPRRRPRSVGPRGARVLAAALAERGPPSPA
jgi:hypothetical protein